MRSSLRALALLMAVTVACSGPSPAVPPSEASTSERRARSRDQIENVAKTIHDNYVDQVSQVHLIACSAAALNAEAGAPEAMPASTMDVAVAQLDAALTRSLEHDPAVSEAHLVQVGAGAMAASLHDQSRVISKHEAQKLRIHANEPWPGAVGLEMRMSDPYPLVTLVIPGSSAAEAGLSAGEEVRAVDGRSTAGLQLDGVVALLVGPVGSTATLILSARGMPPRTVTLRRTQVDRGAIDCRLINERVLYFRFDYLTSAAAKRIQRLADSSGASAQAVILDLRGNSGGLFQEAVSISDLFLVSGDIIRTVGREGSSQNFTATAGKSSLEHARVVVLVDRETANGAEVIAGALQENHRASVMGERTAGSGEVRVHYPIAGGSLLSLVVARLIRPNGQSISGRGITPDVLLDLASDQPASPSLHDIACPGLASVKSVAGDPAVVRAVGLLSLP
jgi:carboxyl-terminal processing protease